MTHPRPVQPRVRLAAGAAILEVDPDAGGRLASLVVAGDEVLVTSGPGAITWGAYPMAPFAGRIRDGRFMFQGRSYELHRNLPPHAIHGTVFDRSWTVTSADRASVAMTIDLGPGWPFPGRVEQRIWLRPDGLDTTMTVRAAEPMPAWIGWHPWFRRRLEGTLDDPRPISLEAELDLPATRMLVRGPDELPTGAIAAPTPPPWDDCFMDLTEPPRVRWPGRLGLELRSTATFWVVYTAAPGGVCVEPQTAPPDAVNLVDAGWAALRPVGPDEPLEAAMTWDWHPA